MNMTISRILLLLAGLSFTSACLPPPEPGKTRPVAKPVEAPAAMIVVPPVVVPAPRP